MTLKSGHRCAPHVHRGRPPKRACAGVCPQTHDASHAPQAAEGRTNATDCGDHRHSAHGRAEGRQRTAAVSRSITLTPRGQPSTTAKPPPARWRRARLYNTPPPEPVVLNGTSAASVKGLLQKWTPAIAFRRPDWAPKKFIWGAGGPLEPLFQSPPLQEGGSNGRLSLFHVFHEYSMTKPLPLSQSVPVTVSLQKRGGGLLLRLSVVQIHPCPPPPHTHPPHKQVGAENFRYLH